jgi:3-hydroxybutyrate dehydrogenase
MAVNISAAFHTIRLAVPGMRERRWGRIVNLSSIYGLIGTVNRVDYVTAKTALIGMTRAIALETVDYGITCNAICPGSALTPSIDARVEALMSAEALSRDAAVEKFLAGKQPSGRFVETEMWPPDRFFSAGKPGATSRRWVQLGAGIAGGHVNAL